MHCLLINSEKNVDNTADDIANDTADDTADDNADNFAADNTSDTAASAVHGQTLPKHCIAVQVSTAYTLFQQSAWQTYVSAYLLFGCCRMEKGNHIQKYLLHLQWHIAGCALPQRLLDMQSQRLLAASHIERSTTLGLSSPPDSRSARMPSPWCRMQHTRQLQKRCFVAQADDVPSPNCEGMCLACSERCCWDIAKADSHQASYLGMRSV